MSSAIHPLTVADRYLVSEVPSPAVSSSSSSPPVTTVQQAPRTAVRQAWSDDSHSPIAKIVNTSVILHLVVEDAPNLALLRVSKAFREKTSKAVAQLIYQKFIIPIGLSEKIPLVDGQRDPVGYIGAHLPVYFQLMINRRVSHFKYEDYTPSMLAETLPFSILSPDARQLALSEIDWNNANFEQRKKEFSSLVPEFAPDNALDIALGLVKYFLSIETDKSFRFASPQIQIRLSQDPLFVSRLIRFIADQIHSVKDHWSAYPEALYSMLNVFTEEHYNDHLTYQDLHYIFLIHLNMVLTRTFADEKKQGLKLGLIDLLLKKIKLKKTHLLLLKQHLYILLSPHLHAQRLTTAAKYYTDSSPLERLYEENLKNVRKILAKHFHEFAADSGCCIIS